MRADSSQNPDRYRLDDLIVDTGPRRVFRGSEEIQLPKLSFDMLVALVEAAPNTLSIEELTDQVWHGVVVSPATVAKRVELLRHALNEDSSNPNYVALVRGHGYRLIPSPALVPLEAEKSKSRHRLAIAAAVAMFAMVGWYLLSDAEPPPVQSIAVLPFANLSPETENEYLSDGLAAELTTLLATIPDLRVAARTSAFAFKGRDIDVTDMARQLRVAHILSGSVRQSGERLRITAQLVEAKDGYHVWSNSWERDLTDIFDIQDEIAAAVIDSLRLQLLQGKPAIQRADPEAYAFYLKGKSAFLEDKEPDIGDAVPEQTTRALSLTMHSLAVDPDYAPAWGQLAVIQANQAQWMTGGAPWETSDRAQAYARAEASARRALELDPDLALALTVLGNVSDSWHWDSESAANWYKRALTAAPGNSNAPNAIAILYGRLGRPTMGHQYHQAAFERDPLNTTRSINLALSYWTNGEFDVARAQLERAKQVAPHAIRVQVFESLFSYLEGDFEQAAPLVEELHPVIYACSLYKMERIEEALAVLQELRSADPPPAYGIATVYACRNDKDSAFAWLQRAYEDHDPELRWIRSNVDMEKLHGDPRWEDLLQKVGVSDDDANKVSAELGNIGL